MPVIRKLYQGFMRDESKVIGVFSACLGMAGSLHVFVFDRYIQRPSIW
jgi:hypothetical protein